MRPQCRICKNFATPIGEPPCRECAKDFFETGHRPGFESSLTNADIVREMPDEELAQFLYWYVDGQGKEPGRMACLAERGGGMSIIIKDLCIQNKKNGAVLIVFPNGKCLTENGMAYQTIELPENHGRLIDADEFDERIRQAGGMCEEEMTEDFKDGVQTVLAMLKTQTTIIPAEGGE